MTPVFNKVMSCARGLEVDVHGEMHMGGHLVRQRTKGAWSPRNASVAGVAAD